MFAFLLPSHPHPHTPTPTRTHPHPQPPTHPHPHTPTHPHTHTQVKVKVAEGYRLPHPQGCPEELYKLMLKCWAQRPTDRPHFSDILNGHIETLQTKAAKWVWSSNGCLTLDIYFRLSTHFLFVCLSLSLSLPLSLSHSYTFAVVNWNQMYLVKKAVVQKQRGMSVVNICGCTWVDSE